MIIDNPVGLIILNEKNDSILLGKRATKSFGFEGMWSIPGGKVDFGETFEEGLKREILEELGCGIKDFTYFTSTFLKIGDRQARSVYFYGHISGDIKIKEDELSECKWFEIDSDFLEDLEIAFEHGQVLKDFVLKKKMSGF